MGGSSKKQTVGYKYYLGCHMVISTGPIDAVHAIEVGERRAWSGNVTGNQAININAPNLFGGEKREGGIQGTVDIMMGGPSQQPNSYLAGVIGGLMPAFRGVVSIVLRQVYIGTNPYIKPWAFLASRLQNQSDGQPAWYPARVAVPAPDGFNDMNPAHIIREALTNTDWGLGYSGPFDIDNASFEAAADVFHDEGLGLSLELTQQEGTEAFIRVVLEHADAALQVDPVTGLWTLKPIRDDYDIEALPVADESTVLEVTRFRRPGWGEMTNQVSLVYEDRESAKEKTVTVQDTALVELQGHIVAQTVRRPGVSNGELAAQMAARELRQMSTPLANGELLVRAEFGFGLRVGSAFKFNWKPLGIQDLVLRVVAIDYGNLLDGTVRLEFAQDVFATTAAVYAPPPPTGWQPPNNDPIPVTQREVMEAPYWSIATEILGEGAQLESVVDEEGGYVIATGRQPVGDAFGFEIWTRTGSAAFEEQGPGDWVQNGTIAAAAVKEVQSTFTLLGAVDLDEVAVDGLALLGDEWVRVLSVNAGASTVTVARGVLDTPPKEHPEGTRLYFVDEGSGFADQVYFAGESVDVRLLTTTTVGTLALGDAPTDTVTMDARALRPYAPGNMRVNGERYPEFIGGGLEVQWSHRDRVQQTAYLVQQDEGNIGPEAGTTYRVRVYGETDQLLLDESGITGTSQSLSLEDEKTASGKGRPEDRLRVTIGAERDGYTSWEEHETETHRAGFGLRFGQYFGGKPED